MLQRLQSLLSRSSRTSTPVEATKARARRRRSLLKRAARWIPHVQHLLLISGCLHIGILPLNKPQLSRRTYLDENAFQPGQVNSYYTWTDVAEADQIAEALADSADKPVARRTKYISERLEGFGLPTSVQRVGRVSPSAILSCAAKELPEITYDCKGISISAAFVYVNVYARLRAPKAAGNEVLVLCAPWLSRDAGRANVRGIALLLSLARNFQKLAVWSKDIIVLFADDALMGTRLWLDAMHDPHGQDDLAAGQVWTAVVIDYPYHSFSSLGVYYNSNSTRLPNQDLVNAAVHIAKWVGGCPVHLTNRTTVSADPEGRSQLVTSWRDYANRGRGIWEHVRHGLSSQTMGPEGLFAEYGTDAIAYYAVPAEGPHGFHTFGRVLESMARAINNLIERLHASYFLYILPDPFTFLPVASYLPGTLLLAASSTIAGLRTWSGKSGDYAHTFRDLLDCLVLWLLPSFSFLLDQRVGMLLPGGALLIFTLARVSNAAARSDCRLALVALQAGLVASVLSIVNFAWAYATAAMVCLPVLGFCYAQSPHWARRVRTLTACLVSLTLLVSSWPKLLGGHTLNITKFAALFLWMPMWLQLLLC